MSAYPQLDQVHPPTASKRFASFASQLVLHAAAAPSGFEHLPAQVAVEVGEADQHFDYIDAAGTAVAMTFPAVGFYVVRMAPVSIETTTTVAAVTVFWNQR